MALLLIDMDDTSVLLLKSATELRNRENPHLPALNWRELDCWDKNGEILNDYFQRPGLFLNLEVAENAVDVLRELHERHTIRFLTAHPSPHGAMEKLLYVDRHFPFIGHKNVTMTWHKGEIRGDLIFDDSPHFLNLFSGGLKVIYDQAYNQHLCGDARVRDWAQFYKLVTLWEQEGRLHPTKK